MHETTLLHSPARCSDRTTIRFLKFVEESNGRRVFETLDSRHLFVEDRLKEGVIRMISDAVEERRAQNTFEHKEEDVRLALPC